jgi:hypothetical protein
MEARKPRNSALIRLHRTKELREFALAALYPLTHSGDAAHLKRTENPPPTPAHPLLRQLSPEVERLYQLEREHRYQRSTGEPKPWKKPWEK